MKRLSLCVTLLAMMVLALTPALADEPQLLIERVRPVGPAVVPPPVAEDTTEEAATDQPADGTDEPAAEPETPKKKVEPGLMKFHLMDGTIITGKLVTKTLKVKTEFGELTVPLSKIDKFLPGLESHPQILEKIQTLVAQLADPSASVRDKAQASLTAYGQDIIPELERYLDDKDAERKVRIGKIVEALYGQRDDFSMGNDGPQLSLERKDRIVTPGFTIAGSILQKSFDIQSKFGKLVVKLEDIKGVEKVSTESPETRRTVEMTGRNIAGVRWKNSGVRLKRGDRVIIVADGQITLTPWGSNSVSGPDGVPRNGSNGNMPYGALTGSIGSGGKQFMIGSKKTFVADRDGVLNLGMSMRSNYVNYQFPGKYEVRIRVIPAE